MCNTPEWNYSRHKTHERSQINEADLPSCYLDPGSIDAWRHFRMYSTLMPIIDELPEASWLTIGDGRYGSDAYFLGKYDIEVVASSLTDTALEFAARHGYINQYRIENAESINLADNSFDFLLCKEAFHHFPRPPIAFYEMLRVSRRAVVLIEPLEQRRILSHLKDLIKTILRKDSSTVFESCGNYLFRVNRREFEKMMTALNYKYIAIRRFNDFYHPRLASHAFKNLSGPVFLTKLGISIQNLLCVLKLLDFGKATIVLFKLPPSTELKHKLKRNRYQLIRLPQNPYV